MKHTSWRQLLRQARATLIQEKQTVMTAVLLAAVVPLLFGIFSRLPAPDLTPAEPGTTTIDYSTFLAKVRAGNVQVVNLQGQEVVGALARPLSEDRVTPTPQTGMTQQQAVTAFDAWYYSPGGDYPNEGAGNAAATPLLQPAQLFSTRLPEFGDAGLIPLLLSKHVVIKTQPTTPPPQWLSQLWKLLPFFVFILLLLRALNPDRRIRSSGAPGDFMSFNPSRNHSEPERRNAPAPQAPLKDTSARAKAVRVSTPSPVSPDLQPPPVTFADVAGIDEVRQEVEELVQFLRDSERFARLGARIPLGALLVGPPGTGKTLLARAVAGEAGVPFFSVSASEFVEMYVGLGAKRVRELFGKARANAPCVIFIDELDAVGRKRSARLVGSDERDQTLNQLLVELDGFSARQTIVVLAATNRADILDPALLRPGRFDRHISVSLPDRAGRLAILQVHTRHIPLGEEVSLERLARLTTGMSGADLANLVNEAALRAARSNLEYVTHACFEEALSRILLGAQRPLILSEAERSVFAYHEAGHALVAHFLPEADRVSHVTILPRGQSLGVTQFVAEEDRYNYSREYLMARLAAGLGGRAAEELAFGPERVTTGAENDFQAVTGLARKMVTRWGMSERVGAMFVEGRVSAGSPALNFRHNDGLACCTLAVGPDGWLLLNGGDPPARQHRYEMSGGDAGEANSASMAAVIDQEVQRLLNEGYRTARELLSDRRQQLDRLTLALMEREQLDRAAFEQLMNS
jgi:ATP-dependent metalloprotease FtsH